jgi:hypothetical protein
MTVKTSQENKEFWRKTKFLHILGVVLAGFLLAPVPLSHSVPGFESQCQCQSENSQIQNNQRTVLAYWEKS